MALSIQERLKDLRVECGLTLEQLAERTHLSKSALGSYEADDFKDISHYALSKLADFCEVTADYILGRSENRNHPNAELSELRLSDEMIERLKSGRIDNGLLCKLAAHPDFPRLMAGPDRTEIRAAEKSAITAGEETKVIAIIENGGTIMQTYGLPCDWQISIPDNWQGEYNEEDGQCIFYPNDSDLTIRITPYHAEREGVLAPVEVMESAYINTVPAAAMPRDANLYNLDGLSAKMYENVLTENNQTIFAIYIGYYAMGELLSINIFGTNKTECEQALDILKTIKRRMP